MKTLIVVLMLVNLVAAETPRDRQSKADAAAAVLAKTQPKGVVLPVPVKFVSQEITFDTNPEQKCFEWMVRQDGEAQCLLWKQIHNPQKR